MQTLNIVSVFENKDNRDENNDNFMLTRYRVTVHAI